MVDSAVRAALSATEILAENSLAAACDRLRGFDYGAAVLSLTSLDCTGDEALTEIFRAAPNLPLIIHHRTGGIGDVIHLTRQGAFHVLLGSIEPESLAEAVSRALRQSLARRRAAAETAPWRHFLIGQSRAMLQICEIIQLVAAKRCTILISGETGTGKELSLIHI